MLTPAEFPERWKKVSGATILKYSLSSPLADGLSPSTAAALKEYGLPNVAGSWLEFGEYDYIEPIVSELEERNLYPIGRVGFFGLICVDKITDKIVKFDINDQDEPEIFNSSLNALYESLLIFESFVAEVNSRNPDYRRNYKIPEGMLRELAEKLTDCDPEAMREKGYWHCQICSLDDSASSFFSDIL